MTGSLLQRREVQALRRHAFFGRRIAQEDDHDAILAFQLGGQRRAGRDRHGAADDGGRARHARRACR